MAGGHHGHTRWQGRDIACHDFRDVIGGGILIHCFAALGPWSDWRSLIIVFYNNRVLKTTVILITEGKFFGLFDPINASTADQRIVIINVPSQFLTDFN